jgi:hypothetical protein
MEKRLIWAKNVGIIPALLEDWIKCELIVCAAFGHM